jgi:hypothetical protein
VHLLGRWASRGTSFVLVDQATEQIAADDLAGPLSRLVSRQRRDQPKRLVWPRTPL